MNRASMEVLRTGEADIAIFAPFTRDWCVDRFFDSLAGSDMPFSRSSFTAYVDSADPEILNHVKTRSLDIDFSEVVVHCSAWPPPAEYARTRERRGRHAAMRTASVGLIPDARYLLLLEDDTTVPKDVWERGTFALGVGYDWISGFEIGRWSCPCPGVWKMEPYAIRSATPKQGIEDVDATGVYCVLTTPEVYRSVPWDVWDNTWGHDISITYTLKQNGFRLGVDWQLTCIHMTQEGDLTTDMWGPLKRNVGPLEMKLQAYPWLEPLTEFPSKGPKKCSKPSSYRDRGQDEVYYRFPQDIEFEGSLWPAKSKVPRLVALAMKDAGVITRRIQ